MPCFIYSQSLENTKVMQVYMLGKEGRKRPGRKNASPRNENRRNIKHTSENPLQDRTLSVLGNGVVLVSHNPMPTCTEIKLKRWEQDCPTVVMEDKLQGRLETDLRCATDQPLSS